MNTADARADAAVYELTIRGSLGPVFHSAVAPHRVSRTDVCTTLRARAASGTDLVDVLLLVAEKGLTIEDAFEIEH
jgi:hypothetical protein